LEPSKEVNAMLREGAWWISSESDPRWDAKGEGIVGMFMMPTEVKEKIAELKSRYGDEPKDLKWEYHKY
jgi:hypothetical protein